MKTARFLGLAVALSLVVLGCSHDVENQSSQLDQIKEEIARLAATTGQLNAVVNSDYATCSNTGGTDNSDALIRKICTVAQAATAEARTEMKGELAVYSQMLQSQIDAVNNTLANHAASIASVQASITTINGQITSLTTRMTNAETAITALQALTASISGTLATNLIEIMIGNENSAAGPLYESMLRRQDKTRFNAYVNATSFPVSLPSNPVAATSGSATVVVSVPSSTVTITIASPGVVTWTAHGLSAGAPVRFTSSGTLPTGIGSGTVYYVAASPAPTANTFSVAATSGGTAINTSGSQSGTHTASNMELSTGDIVSLTGLVEGAGFTAGDFVKENTVTATAANFSTFSVALQRNATSTTSIGGTSGVARKVNGHGMSTLWSSTNPSDTAVRVADLGSKPYNFIIRRIASDATNNTAELCYDKTNNLATFGTINGAPEGGSGNIVCK